MKKCTLVVGGGIAGLFSAWLLKHRNPNREVMLLEAEPDCGGLLRSFNYGDMGRFDYGVHTLYETGVSRIDEAILGTLPDQEWQYLSGREKDLGASWLDGKYQFDTPYPVISERADSDELIADFLRHFGTSSDQPCSDAHGELIRLYGPKIAKRLLIPAIAERQNLPAEQVDVLALKVHGMGRIAALPLETVLKLAQITDFNSRIAFPNQRHSPQHMIADKRALYPKAGHLAHFTDRFVDRVKKLGVKVLNAASLRAVNLMGGQITSVVYDHAESGTQSVDVDLICWCAGIPSVAKALGMAHVLEEMTRPPTTVICNLLVDKEPKSGSVYYGYFHGKPIANRFSFPANISRMQRQDGLTPIALELLYQGGADTSNSAQVTEEAFRSSGIIGPDTKIVFAKSEVLKAGYPSLSLANVSALKATRDAIEDQNLSNLFLFGPMVRDDLFFQFDVLRHVEETLGA